VLEQHRQSRKTMTITKETDETIRRHDDLHIRARCCGKTTGPCL